MNNYKLTDKFTIFYFGDANSTTYKATTTTLKTLKAWKEKGDKKLRDIAAVLEGTHRDITSFQWEDYMETNKDKIVNLRSILNS